jgi:hypothetical protein
MQIVLIKVNKNKREKIKTEKNEVKNYNQFSLSKDLVFNFIYFSVNILMILLKEINLHIFDSNYN